LSIYIYIHINIYGVAEHWTNLRLRLCNLWIR